MENTGPGGKHFSAYPVAVPAGGSRRPFPKRRAWAPLLLACLSLPAAGCRVQTWADARHQAAGFFLSRAILRENAGKFNQALTLTNFSLKFDPANPLAFYFRGILFIDLDDRRRAVVDFTRALECVPARPPSSPSPVLSRFAAETEWLFLFRGRCYARLGQETEAARDFRYALKANPNLTDAHFELGQLCRRQSRHAEAAACFSAVIRLDPTNAKAFNERGLAYYYQNDFPRAVRDFSQAVKLAPDEVLYCNRGLAQASLGRFKRAAEDFRQAIRLNPLALAAYHYLGQACERMHRPREAAEAYRQYRSLSDAHPDLKKKTVLVRWGSEPQTDSPPEP